MAVLTDNVKKGTFYTLGQNGYEKLCPYANEVYMQDGTTVEDKISGLSFTDGTSGNWYYRKWDNGWAEMWGYVATTTAKTYAYDGGCKVQVNYPFTFIGQVRCFASFGSKDDAWASLRYVTSSTTMIEAHGKRNDNSNGQASWFNFYVAGRWK